MGIGYNTSIVRDGLVFYLDAANPKSYPGTGTTWFDLKNTGNNGSLVNGVGFDTENQGSLFFDGVNDFVINGSNLSAINNITNSSSFTFSSTLKVNSFPSTINATVTGILMKGSYNPSYGINLLYGGDTNGFRTTVRILCGLRNLSGTSGVTQGHGFASLTSEFLELEKWYKVDMVHEFSSTTHTLKLYLNGILNAQNTFTNSLFPINFQNTSSLGINLRILSGNFLHSNINLGQSSIYNKALSEQEIKNNFEATRGRYGI